jgi:glycine hydroxymethyltransferase
LNFTSFLEEKMNTDHLKKRDPELGRLLAGEEQRQADTICLIPSENYVSRAVMEATGSCLTNKYSEGYPGRRYYQGQEYIDQLENLGIERAKALFGVEHANIQPYSGSIGVIAAYFAAGCKTGDTVMGLSLTHGGHLSHGHKVNLTGKIFKAVQYGVSEGDELIDYDELALVATQERPKMILAGATAYPRIIDFERIKQIADKVGAVFVADISHLAGLIVGGVHPSPFPHADIAVTTTHKTLRGPRGSMLLCNQEYAKAVDRAVFPLLQGGPHQHTQAGITVALKEAATPQFKDYAAQVVKNAKAMGESLKEKGYRLVSGGTDNHMVLVDLRAKDINGADAAILLEDCGLVCNMNTIPFDPGTPMKPSGVRMGTPAITTRGFTEKECAYVGELTARIIENRSNQAELDKVQQDVKALCDKFPIPEDMV